MTTILQKLDSTIDTTFGALLPTQDVAKGVEHIALLVLFAAPTPGAANFLAKAKQARFALLATFFTLDAREMIKGNGFWTQTDPHKMGEDGCLAISDITILILFLDGMKWIDLGKYKNLVVYTCDATWVGYQVFHYRNEKEYELNAAVDVALAITTVMGCHPVIVGSLGVLAVATSQTLNLVGGPAPK